MVPRIANPLHRQRLKLLYYIWGYAGLLGIKGLTLPERLRLFGEFLRVDWNVLHAHLPSEIVQVTRALAERRARAGEVMVEAGCWQGGSSAKFSLVCRLLGYELWIHDSFQGVEVLSPQDQAKEWDFGGQYASGEERLRDHLDRFGALEVCRVRPGWFADTLALAAVPRPVRAVWIDCDLGKGTLEVLRGVVPSLSDDGWIFSQDFHIEPVRRVLRDPEIWREFGRGIPTIRVLGRYLASVRFSPPAPGRVRAV
ncbi:MAG TPA: TylF/MycF/NovP-related O-methyltransferase [Gemmatimonadales bacterium]|nr:TylF/MycF/NovP-related O-methyltransferase [Gemmatimonadales bacterium]HEV8600335.1 TylF/MycF/NovP-related O-methyltransferase [Gemmatimonadales bacterium]